MAPSIALLTGQQIARWAASGAVAVYAYDILITLDTEISLFWSRLDWDVLSVVYPINRYVCFILYTNGSDFRQSPGRCTNVLSPLAMELGRACWTGVMTLRTWAMWRESRIVSKLLCIIGPAFAIMTVLYVPLGDIEHRRKWQHWDPERGSCVRTGASASWTKIPSILGAVYVTLLTLLTTVKCLHYVHFSLDKKSYSSRLVRAIMKDGLQYYFVVTTATLACLISSRLAPSPVLTIIFNLSLALTSTAVSRFVLNLRRLAKENLDEDYAITCEDEKTTLESNQCHPSHRIVHRPVSDASSRS
ncbi:hypothetical protein CPB86DRAFT_787706, partial [Serendipita vermifera]